LTGPAGADGLDNVTWLGTWDSGATYITNDAVFYLGSSYRSLTEGNLGNQPDLSPSSWTMFAAGGGSGNATLTYGGNLTGATAGAMGYSFNSSGASTSATVRTVGVRGLAAGGASGTYPTASSVPSAIGLTANFTMGVLGNTNAGNVGVFGLAGAQTSVGSWGHNSSTGASNWNVGVLGSTLGTHVNATGVFGQGNRGVSGLSTIDTNGSASSGRILSGGVYGETTNADGSSGYFLGRVTIDNTSANGSDTSGSDGLIVWSNSGASGFNSSGALFTPSDRNSKMDFTPVDSVDVLNKVVAMPVTTWHYKNDDKTLYMGPMAQDFHSTFGLGDRDTVIHGVNADGVALAAVQGLNTKLGSELALRDSRLARLESQMNELQVALKAAKVQPNLGGIGLGGLIIGVPLLTGLAVSRRRNSKRSGGPRAE